jgi:tetratricopeptide (TPR) repeat protein
MLKPKVKITKKEMKKDPLLETINTVFEKYNEYKSMIFRAGIGIIALTVIIIFLFNRQGSQQKPAAILLGNALVSLDTGDIENAQFQFEVLTGEHGSTRSGKTSNYYLGSIYFDKGDYDDAKTYLEQFINSASENILLSSGHFMLSNIYKRESNQDKEEEHLELAVKFSSIPHNRHSLELALAELYVDKGTEEMAMEIVQKILNLENISSGNKKKAEELSGFLTRK